MMDNEKFFIYKNEGEINILVREEGENLVLLGLDCADVKDANYLAYELESVVKLLNEQHNILKENGLQIL